MSRRGEPGRADGRKPSAIKRASSLVWGQDPFTDKHMITRHNALYILYNFPWKLKTRNIKPPFVGFKKSSAQYFPTPNPFFIDRKSQRFLELQVLTQIAEELLELRRLHHQVLAQQVWNDVDWLLWELANFDDMLQYSMVIPWRFLR